MAHPLHISLRGYIDSNDSTSAEPHLRDVVSAVLESRLSSTELVQLLQEDLTTDENTRRRAGTRLLAEVIDGAPGVLSRNELQHFSAFFSARLSDWPAVAPAAQGCNALLKRAPNHPTPLLESEALDIIKSFLTNVHVQSLSQSERYACYSMWLTALKVWGVAAACSGLDLVEGTIAAMDAERDPRCLLVAFECVQELLRVYDTPGVPSECLDASCDEMLDVVASYFPVAFTPPKDNPHGITRQMLVDALHATMTCSQSFAPFTIPLIQSKLSSTSKSAKEDSLLLLKQCFNRFNSAAFAPQLEKLWVLLKTEMLSPASAVQSDPDEVATKQGLASLAGAALAEGIQALSASADQPAGQPDGGDVHMAEAAEQLEPGSLLALVMEDAVLVVLFDALERGAGGGGAEERRRVCAVNVAAAAASASSSAAARLLPRLLASCSSAASIATSPQRQRAATITTEASTGSTANGATNAGDGVGEREGDYSRLSGALDSLHVVLAAMAAAIGSATPGSEGLRRVVSQHTEELVGLLTAVAGHTKTSYSEDAAPGDSAPEVNALTALLWSHLVSIPSLLLVGQLEVAAEQLAALASDSTAGKEVVLASDPKACATSAAGAAVVALKHLAQDGNEDIICNKVIPKLVSQAVDPQALSNAALDVLLELAVPPGNVWLEAQQRMLPHVLQAVELCQEEPASAFLSRAAEAAAGPLDQPPPPYPADASKACGCMIVEVLRALTASSEQGQTLPGPLVDACCCYVTGLLPHCSEEDQSGPAAAALSLLTRYTVTGGLAQTVPPAAAVVLALRPQVLTTDVPTNAPPGGLAFVNVVVSAERAARSAERGAHVSAAVTLGSVVGKLPLEPLDMYLQPLLSDLFAASAAADTRSSALRSLGWLGRATAMRGHPAYLQVADHAIDLLSLTPLPAPPSATPPQPPSTGPLPTSSISNPSAQVHLSSTAPSSAWLAARILRTMVSVDPAHLSLRLSKSFHCQQKPLWQQRTFTLCFQKILSALSSGTSGTTAPVTSTNHPVHTEAAVSPTNTPGIAAANTATATATAKGVMPVNSAPDGVEVGSGDDPRGGSQQGLAGCSGRDGVLLAAGCLVASVPPQVYRTVLKDVPDVLLEAVPVVSREFSVRWTWLKAQRASGSLASTEEGGVCVEEIREVLLGCLMVLGDFLMDSGARGEIEARVDVVVSVLEDLAVLPGASAVREAALQCLVALMELPYHLLHPHKRKVLKVAMTALDDDIRSVRQAAVKCRAVWTSS